MLKKFLIGTFVAAAFMVVGLSTASADCSITTTLKVGSTGTEVSCLQTKVGATADGSFGPMTKASVMAYQASHGLSADGVVGPLSRAVLNGSPVVATAGCPAGALFNSMTGASCTVVTSSVAGCAAGALFSATTGASCVGGTVVVTGALAGTAGTVTFTQLSQYSNEEIGSGQKDIKIAGFELEAADGDVGVNSFKLTLDDTGYEAGDSTRIIDYLDSVSIWQGATKIGTANTVDFTRDSTGVYSKIVSVAGSVVRDNATEKFYITANANSNIDTEDLDLDSWTIDIINVRYTDGSGVVSTDTITLTPVAISFVTAGSASDTVLKISTNSTPLASIVDVDATNDTNDVVLLKGKFVLDGTSDVWMDTLPIQLTAVTGTGSIAAITGSVSLTLGNNTYTESISATNCVAEADYTTVQDCTAEANEVAGVLFDNLDYTITAGSTVNFTVKADINDLNDGTEATDFDAGDSLKAEFTAAARALAAFVVENKQGDALATTEKTGSALGNAQSFYATGINVALVSKTATKTTSPDTTTVTDTGTYVINFDVTAIGADMYIDKTSGIDADVADGFVEVVAGQGVAYSVSKGGTAADAAVATFVAPSAILTADGTTTDDSTTDFKVAEGATRHFHLTVTVGLNHADGTDSDGYYKVNLGSINWATADATADSFYTFNLSDYSTSDLLLSDYSMSS